MNDGNHELEHKVDVGAQRVAHVYAEALLNTAEKYGQTESVLEELDSLITDLFEADAQFESFLSGSAVSREHKAQVICRTFEHRASEIFANFLLVLNHQDRLELLRPILAAARELFNQRQKRLRVQVKTAVPLADDQRSRLQAELRQTFRLEPLLETHVDPELLGGMVVRIGDWLFDASVRNRLETIRNQLIERSSHEIQSERDRFGHSEGN